MLNSLSAVIVRHYSPRIMGALLAAAAGFFWLFNFSTLPLSNPELMKLSGGEGLLDLKLFYTAQEALSALNRYGVEGRELYRRFLVADFVFPLVYSFGFAFLLTRTARAVRGSDTPWLRVNLLPLGIALFDYVENICVLGMLTAYPEAGVSIGTLAGIATLSKHLLTLAALLCLTFGGLILLMRRLGLNPCPASGIGNADLKL